MPTEKYLNAVGLLREAMVGIKTVRQYKPHILARDEVFARFQPIFSADHIGKITKEEFYSFLLLENNKHWSGLNRQGSRICSDMQVLRKSLRILVDESQPVEKRLNRAVPMVPGLGRNIATAILLVTQPDRHGVWNTRSEGSMKKLGLWPSFDRGDTLGNRYGKINQVLLKLRDELQTDLWTLDSLWWYIDEYGEGKKQLMNGDTAASVAIDEEQRFGLERHLHEFMRDNWKRLDLGKEWDIYSEAGAEDAGYEYPCEVGRIDLLARHKKKPMWLVIELKRNQTSDQTIGQLLRYVGWVRQNMAAKGEEVHGMIVGREADQGLRYALSTISNVELMLYEVDFRLVKPKPINVTK